MSLLQKYDPSEILFEKCKVISTPPSEEDFKNIAINKKAMSELFMNELKQFSSDPKIIKKFGDNYIRHTLSLFLLAFFQHKAAYPLVIKLISQPGDQVIKLTGEVFTEALARILASVCDGDTHPIKDVIENPQLNPWIRAAALDSLMVLWKEDVVSRDELVFYLKELLDNKLERKASYVWDAIALIAYDLHPSEIETSLRLAIKEKLIEPIVLDDTSLNRCLKDDLISIIKNKQNVVEGYIKEPIKELTWWLYPDKEALDKGMEYAALAVPLTDKKVVPGERSAPIGWRAGTILHSNTKLGRNEPCFCGSGKKYKKCCAD